MGLIDSMQKREPAQQQESPGIALAREATLILHKAGEAAAQRIMLDGKADLDEMGEVAANLVAGAFRKAKYPQQAIAEALPIVCITVAEYFDSKGGLDWMGSDHNAKAAAREVLPRAVLFMKKAHIGG